MSAAPLLTLPWRRAGGTMRRMEHSFDDQWRAEDGQAATLLHKAGALALTLVASAGFVVIVLWPLFAAP
jgi:hypothetical protein